MKTKLSNFASKVKLLTDKESKEYAITFTDSFYSTLKNIQTNNQSNHKISPTKLTNGRWMICADILRESLIGDLYKNIFNDLYNNEVDVIDMKDAISLLPVSEVEF